MTATPEQMFERLSADFLADPAVGQGTGFGSSPGLRVDGKIFAMLVKGELVVKLPKERVDQLIASGTGARFDPGHGRLMKEWVTIPARRGADWKQWGSEALQFVRSAAGSPRRR
jgi:hypothetical protein